MPPPLALEEPSSADEPGLASEGARSIERSPDAVLREAAPAHVTASPTAPMEDRESLVDDDPYLRASDVETDTAGFAGAMRDEGWAARHPAERGEDLAAGSGETLEVGFAALPAAGAVRPPLSLGLDDDGASSARRRALLAAIIALLAAVATLAVSRM